MEPHQFDMIRGRSLNVAGKLTFLYGGEFHYFRIPRTQWNDRLKKARAAYLNIIGSYMPWNLHEHERGEWRFDGDRDIRAWLELIRGNGLLFFARPGPYICSEWDMGGLPPWLMSEADAVRTVDSAYMAAVRRWFGEVNRLLRDFLPEAGGSLALYQIENEFIWGELPYFLQMADWVRSDGITVPILTNLNPAVRRGTPVADTLDLYPGPWNISKPEIAIAELLADQPDKLAGCVEFQMGFAAETGTTLPTMVGQIPESWVELHLKNSIARGLNLINFYMFCGGTTRGYHTGRRDISSYDYDSAIREWSELGGKYYMARRIGGFLRCFGDTVVNTLPFPDIPVDAPRGVSVLQRRGEKSVVVFPRNLTGSPQEIAVTIDLPGGETLTIPQKSRLRLAPQSIKMLPLDVEIGGSMTLVYSTSDIFGVYRLEDEVILVVYGLPGDYGEIMIDGFDSYDHCRGDAAVEQRDSRLLVSFLHRRGAHHILLAGDIDEDMEHTLSGVRIIATDTDTAARTWTGIRGADEFPLISDIYFMDSGSAVCESDVLRLPVSLEPGRSCFVEFPCNFTPIMPPSVFLDGEQIERVTADKILKKVRIDFPAIDPPALNPIKVSGWRMSPEDPLSLNHENIWKPYLAYLGNERSGSFEAGYYGYRCTFTFDGDSEGMKLHLTEIHDNAAVYLNGACLGGVTAADMSGARFSADVSSQLRAGENDLFILLESEGRPRKGDEATPTGITGPVALESTMETIPLVFWKRGILRFEAESMLSAVPYEAKDSFDDSGWETVEVRQGWDSRMVIPPSTTYIEHGHERLYVVYRTTFSIPGDAKSGGLILDVGKADGKCWIYLNGSLIDKKHQERFCTDLSGRFKDGDNTLVIILRNFRWYTTIGLHGEVQLRLIDKVLGDSWEFIRGPGGERNGLPDSGSSGSWSALDTDEIPGPAWLAAEFQYNPPNGWTAPPGLRLSGWNANINIFLNGLLVGRFHPEGPQERFYLPEDCLQETNRLVLFCNTFGSPVRVGAAEISPYYMVKEGTLEIRF